MSSMPTGRADPSELNISLAALSVFVCGFGLISYVVKHRLYVSEVLVAALFGVIIGPHVTGWVDPRGWSHEHFSASGISNPITLAVTRIALVIQVLFAGISLPRKYIKIEARSLLILLAGATISAWFSAALFIWWLIPGLTYQESLALSGCMVSTDPVLVNSITKGRYAEEDVDPAVRDLIIAESGSNDGFSYPFLYLPIYWIVAHSSDPYPISRNLGGVIARWVYDVWIYRVLMSIVVGAIIGYVARKALRYAENRKWLDEENFLSYGIGLAFFCLGFMGLMGTDDLLGAFIAGNVFSWDDRQRQLHEDESIHDILDTLINAAVFIYIGATIPFDLFGYGALNIGPRRLVALAACIVFFRRLPWVTLMHWVIPALRNWRHGFFVGWFGPTGVASIFFVTLALQEIPNERERLREVAEPVVYFMVMTSVIVYGVSIPASKGLSKTWDAAEQRWFPKQWAKYQEEKDDRDRELRAAEESDRVDTVESQAPDAQERTTERVA